MHRVIVTPNVSQMSLVGISGKFPFKHGNYCWIEDPVHGSIYMANMWAENIQHMQQNNMFFEGKVEIELFEQNGQKYGFVTDENVFKAVKHEPYFCGIKVCIALIKWYYNIDEDECLCSDMTTFNAKMTGGCTSYHYAMDRQGRDIKTLEGRSILVHTTSQCAECNAPVIKVGDVFTKTQVK